MFFPLSIDMRRRFALAIWVYSLALDQKKAYNRKYWAVKKFSIKTTSETFDRHFFCVLFLNPEGLGKACQQSCFISVV